LLKKSSHKRGGRKRGGKKKLLKQSSREKGPGSGVRERATKRNIFDMKGTKKKIEPARKKKKRSPTDKSKKRDLSTICPRGPSRHYFQPKERERDV